jgi:hypothetical protein
MTTNTTSFIDMNCNAREIVLLFVQKYILAELLCTLFLVPLVYGKSCWNYYNGRNTINKIVLSEGMLKGGLPTDRSKVTIIGSVKVTIKY